MEGTEEGADSETEGIFFAPRLLEEEETGVDVVDRGFAFLIRCFFSVWTRF